MALHLHISPVNAGASLGQVAPLGPHLEYRDPFWISPGCPEKSTRVTEGPGELPCEGREKRRSGTALWLSFGPEKETDRFILSAHRTEPGPGVTQGDGRLSRKMTHLTRWGRGQKEEKGEGEWIC